jgi:hypothetical protein
LKKIITIISFLIVSLLGFAQDLSGIWKGTLTMTSGCFPVNNIELQINISGDSITGDSYHYLDVSNYVKKRMTGSYNADLKKISLNEFLVTAFKIPTHCRVCIKNYELVYVTDGDQEFLQGLWNGTIMNSEYDCMPGNITLSRIKKSAFADVPEIKVDTGTIRLDFYDNAEIDGDSISILHNKQLILVHQKLGIEPITAYIKVDLQNTFHEIEMIAENLGSIPPNTAMLVISAGDKRRELYLTYTKQKSAIIRFEYDPREAFKNPSRPNNLY